MESIYPFIRFITIDESKCSYKGEIYFKQYMKNEHKKFVIKFFLIIIIIIYILFYIWTIKYRRKYFSKNKNWKKEE